MPNTRKPRPLFLFYVLVIYVFIQFGWWSYMLVELNNEVYQQRTEILNLKATHEPALASTEQLSQEGDELNAKLHKRWLMIIGEAGVFLALLVLGIMRTRNSFRKEAALAEQQKNFLLSVTHELKSPLASARLMHETLLHRELPREKQTEMLHDALQDIDRLHTLVENILLAARIDNHTYAAHRESSDLSALTKEIAERSAAPFLRAHRFEADISPGIHAAVDKFGYPSILLNLLENAAKYSPKDSVIRLSLVQLENGAVLTVSDHGPGISDSDKAMVFRKFYRVGNEETRSAKGTGLGLYIVQSLVDAHGWSIRIIDRPGGGSMFEIKIPNA